MRSVQRNAGTYEVAVALGVAEYPGTAGGVNVARLDAPVRSRLQHAAEVVEVAPRAAAVVSRVSGSQMRHDALQAKVRPLVELVQETLRSPAAAARSGSCWYRLSGAWDR